MLSLIDTGRNIEDLINEFNVLDSIYWIKSAWDDVTETCIVNCYKKAGFYNNVMEIEYDYEDLNEI